MAGFPRWAFDAVAGIERLDEAVAEPLLSSDKYLLLLLRLEPGQVDLASILSQGRRLLAHAEALKKTSFFFPVLELTKAQLSLQTSHEEDNRSPFSAITRRPLTVMLIMHVAFCRRCPPTCCVVIGCLTFASCVCVCVSRRYRVSTQFQEHAHRGAGGGAVQRRGYEVHQRAGAAEGGKQLGGGGAFFFSFFFLLVSHHCHFHTSTHPKFKLLQAAFFFF